MSNGPDFINDSVTYHKKFFSGKEAAERDSWQRNRELRKMDRGTIFYGGSYQTPKKKYKRI